jgi:hypothetical protein
MATGTRLRPGSRSLKEGNRLFFRGLQYPEQEIWLDHWP